MKGYKRDEVIEVRAKESHKWKKRMFCFMVLSDDFVYCREYSNWVSMLQIVPESKPWKYHRKIPHGE